MFTVSTDETHRNKLLLYVSRVHRRNTPKRVVICLQRPQTKHTETICFCMFTASTDEPHRNELLLYVVRCLMKSCCCMLYVVCCMLGCLPSPPTKTRNTVVVCCASKDEITETSCRRNTRNRLLLCVYRVQRRNTPNRAVVVCLPRPQTKHTETSCCGMFTASTDETHRNQLLLYVYRVHRRTTPK